MSVTVVYGAMRLGSAVWGLVAGMIGLSDALFIAAAGALVAIPLTWRWKLQTAAAIDFTPSIHWPAPVTTHAVELDRVSVVRRFETVQAVFEGRLWLIGV
jgi:hypothetical protein